MHDAVAALKLQLDWGVDEALADAPVDRFAALAARRVPLAAPAATARDAPRTAPPRPAALRTPPVLTAKAQAIAAACATRDELYEALKNFTDCPLAATATNLVFADGNQDTGLVFVGEAPGAEEDIAGKPFVGASGKLLDKMLASIGISRATCLITNLVPWRPPGNRAATDAEIAMCLPFLERHLALLKPRIVVTLGGAASTALTADPAGISRQRGTWRELSLAGLDRPVALLPMFHPAYLLHQPSAKREAWADLIKIKRKLDELAPTEAP
jgi:DNA polymerase